MNRSTASLLSAATLAVAALGLCGCGSDGAPHAAAPRRAVGVAGGHTAPLPAPEELTGVLYRLADPSIPGEQKLALLQFATPADQPVLTNFGEALRDAGFRDVVVSATDLAWAPQPQDVVAIVTFGAGDDPTRSFTYPMEFSPMPGGWQLTRRTADQLLQLGSPTSPPPPPAPSAPAPR